jgi:hypothetical protein
MHTGTHNSVLSFILHVIHEISNNSAEKAIPGKVLRSMMIFKFGQVGSPSRRCGCFWLVFCSYLLVAARQLLMGWTSVQRQKTIPGKSWLKCTSLQFKLHSQTILVSQTQGYKIKWHISVSISSLSLSLLASTIIFLSSSTSLPLRDTNLPPRPLILQPFTNTQRRDAKPVPIRPARAITITNLDPQAHIQAKRPTQAR